MRLSKTAVLAGLFIIVGCETSEVDQEKPAALPTADSPALSQEDVPEPSDELERAAPCQEHEDEPVSADLGLLQEFPASSQSGVVWRPDDETSLDLRGMKML